MKTLNIIASAYRATIEEQDDTVVWICHAMKGAGADIEVLLRGNAVNYAVRGQNAKGLTFGSWSQTQPPQIEHDVSSLHGKGVVVHVLDDDLVKRGLANVPLIDGVYRVRGAALPEFLGGFERIWHW